MSNLVTNLNIKQPDGSYESHDIGVEAENVIGLEDVIEDMEAKITTSFKGTHAEWEALTTEEKAQYTEVIFTDDYTDESVMQGATGNADGAEGMVPQPLTGDQNKVLFGDGTWKRINNDISNLAPAYDPTLTYDVDDLVTYIDAQGSGKLYKCIVAVTTPEAFNINKWDDVTTSEVYSQKRSVTSFEYSGATLTMIYNDLLDVLRTLTPDQIINTTVIYERGNNRELSHCELYSDDWCYFDTIRTTYENSNIKGLRLNLTTGVFGEYINRINRDETVTHIDQDLTVTSTITRMRIYY